MPLMKVLGIESSCDETAVALYDSQRGLLGQALYSQLHLHNRFGGVVPELAARDHLRHLLPLLQRLMVEQGCRLDALDAVAYTSGPGLIGALLVGASFGRALAMALAVPALAIHHLEAHLLSPLLEQKKPDFPFLALLVSGGHTQLIRVDALGCYRLLGESLDDAAGEAFDKVSKMLGAGYPGGPAIAALARQGKPGAEIFPRPLCDRAGLDMSFSGLKTSVLYRFRKQGKAAARRADIACGFEQAVVDSLAIKTQRALQQERLSRLVVVGGVGANQKLRQRLLSLPVACFFPRPAYCTDNAAMVALSGCLRLQQGETTAEPLQIRVFARGDLPGRSGLTFAK